MLPHFILVILAGFLLGLASICGAQYRGGYLETCENAHLDDTLMFLVAWCQGYDPKYSRGTILDLNLCIGNDDGNLVVRGLPNHEHAQTRCPSLIIVC